MRKTMIALCTALLLLAGFEPATATTADGWTAVTGVDLQSSDLGPMVKLSDNDIRAFGYDKAVRFDGSKWSDMPGPKISTDAALALSPDKLWVSGNYDYGKPGLELWDGKKWSQEPMPTVQKQDMHRLDLVGDQPFAPGGCCGEAAYLNRYLNGKWVDVPLPEHKLMSYIQGVGGPSVEDMWSVGVFASDDPQENAWILHGAPGKWQRVKVPGLPDYTSLYNVYAPTKDNVWLAGYYNNGNPVFAHYDGKTWSVEPNDKLDCVPFTITSAGGYMWAWGNVEFHGNKGSSLLRRDKDGHWSVFSHFDWLVKSVTFTKDGQPEFASGAYQTGGTGMLMHYQPKK